MKRSCLIILLIADVFIVVAILAWVFSRQTEDQAPEEPEKAVQEDPASGPSSDATPAEEVSTRTNQITATVRALDRQGHPIPGLIPIATLAPNAFDEPVAAGGSTGADGRASITLTTDQRQFVRIWDPELHWFANNYFDVAAGEGQLTDEMDVVMVEAAAVEARLLADSETPIANERVGLMLSHPSRGPWWPSESMTGLDGSVTFEAVPPGEYVLALKAGSGGRIELPGVFLPPGGKTDLGPLVLQ